MPGSPPSTVTDPGTRPPWSTRSSSPTWVADGAHAAASTSAIGSGTAPAGPTALGRAVAGHDLLDERAPRLAGRAPARPLRFLGAALLAAVGGLRSGHGRHPTAQGVTGPGMGGKWAIWPIPLTTDSGGRLTGGDSDGHRRARRRPTGRTRGAAPAGSSAARRAWASHPVGHRRRCGPPRSSVRSSPPSPSSSARRAARGGARPTSSRRVTWGLVGERGGDRHAVRRRRPPAAGAAAGRPAAPVARVPRPGPLALSHRPPHRHPPAGPGAGRRPRSSWTTSTLDAADPAIAIRHCLELVGVARPPRSHHPRPLRAGAGLLRPHRRAARPQPRRPAATAVGGPPARRRQGRRAQPRC